MQKKITILWADDEIDLLRPHIFFLQSKGFHIITVTNANDALQVATEQPIDMILLDENMPGKSGLDIILPLKQALPGVPIVMITKSEEENIMNNAIGSQIDDYLIKPINPNQILLSIKKHIENRKLILTKTTHSYQTHFSSLSQCINTAKNFSDWCNIYKQLVFWELQLENTEDELLAILKNQKNEANAEFSKFIKNNYLNWFNINCSDKPLLSPSVLSKKIFSYFDLNEKILLVIIDNMRYDQWRYIMPTLMDFCKLEWEDLYCSILPTATQYARNALFSGLMPLEIEQMFPHLWIDEETEESKNLNESELLHFQLKRYGKNIPLHYEKINNHKAARQLYERFSSLKDYCFIVTVYNFVDILSHARTQTEIIKELVMNEAAYRSVTLSWFQHSYVFDIIKKGLDNGYKVVITTDHGSIQVNNAIKVMGDKHTTSNLRYKSGKNLNYKPSEVFEIKKPQSVHLPSNSISSTYIFATKSDYFVYPNNYNQFVAYYRNTFQHGGISLEEMLIPIAMISAK